LELNDYIQEFIQTEERTWGTRTRLTHYFSKGIMTDLKARDIRYCNVHILRAICKHLKRHLGAHFYKIKIFLEFFKCVTGAFYLDMDNKDLKNEFFKLLDSFVPRAGRINSAYKSNINKCIKYLKNNFFGHRARFPARLFNLFNTSGL
jgi:hypothetical protein